MAKDLELKLVIRADGTAAVQGLRQVDGAVDDVGESAERASAPLQNLTNTLFSFDLLRNLVGDLGDAGGAMLEMAESAQLLESRLGLAVEGFGDAETAMGDVRRIANESGQALDSVGDLYVKVAGAAQSLGLNQQQVATVTETVSRAMRVAGADGQSAAGAIQQFSQALTGGTLRAEEFNSVVEAAPYFVDRLAEGLGVAREELKSMVDAGLVSSRDLADAVQQVSAEIEADYAKLPRTVGQSMAEVRNELALYVAGLNESSGVTETLSAAIGVLADNVSLIGPAAAAAAAGGMAKLTQAGTAYVASIKQQVSAGLDRAAQQQRQALADADQIKRNASLAASEVTLARASQATAAAELARFEARARSIPAGQLYGKLSGELAAKQAALAAATKAVTKAELEASAAQRVAAGAMAGTAAKVTLLTRALSFLGGPGGILLATVAGFAAFALAQRDAKAATDELTASVDQQYEALETLNEQQMETLAANLEQMADKVRQAAAEERKLAEDAEAAAQALSGRNRTTERLAQLEQQANEHRGNAAVKDKELAEIEARLTEVRNRYLGMTEKAADTEGQRAESLVVSLQALEALGKAEEAATKTAQTALQAQIQQQQTAAERAKALGEEEQALNRAAIAQQLVVSARQLDVQATDQALERIRKEIALREASGQAKAGELAALNQTLAALGQEREKRLALVAAAQEEARQALVTAQTYGDQSAQLDELIAKRDRLRAAILAEEAAGKDAAVLYEQLAELNVRIKDAADDAAAAIDRKREAIQQELDLATASNDLARAEIELSIQRAEARGNDQRVQSLGHKLAKLDIELSRANAEAKRQESEQLLEKARVARIAAEATGGLTAEEEAQIAASEHAAAAARLEAERLDVLTKSKQLAAREARKLADEQRRLADAFESAGLAGVDSMADVQSLLRTLSDDDLPRLRTALEAAWAAGVFAADEYKQLLDQIDQRQQSMQDDAFRDRTVTVDPEQYRERYDATGDADYSAYSLGEDLGRVAGVTPEQIREALERWYAAGRTQGQRDLLDGIERAADTSIYS